ncbi:hypothetical protein J1614_007540 [Plenodomus biglobosus]|nr:hypothetical protein J1614_007540 [Plenodomus biglobosus]
MASQPSTTPQLPTVWLSPPETLPSPSLPTNLDPISLTISCIFASLSLIIFLLLLFKYPKRNYTDDTADDEPYPAPPHKNPHVHLTPVSHIEFPLQQRRDGDKDNNDANGLISEALYAEYRRRGLGTGTSMQRGVGFGAGRGGGEGMQYAASFVPSEFVPLVPEAVGLHERVWRPGGEGGLSGEASSIGFWIGEFVNVKAF